MKERRDITYRYILLLVGELVRELLTLGVTLFLPQVNHVIGDCTGPVANTVFIDLNATGALTEKKKSASGYWSRMYVPDTCPD